MNKWYKALHKLSIACLQNAQEALVECQLGNHRILLDLLSHLIGLEGHCLQTNLVCCGGILQTS